MPLERKRKREKSLFILIIPTLILFLVFTQVTYSAENESVAALRQMGKAFSSIAQKASPAVVSVHSESIVTPDNSQSQLYEYFFGEIDYII